MLIGVPREVKNNEYRVGLIPDTVAELCRRGHEVLVEQSAGAAIGFDDSAYQNAGARMMPGPAAVYEEAELIVKVKEPTPDECQLLHPGHCLFAFLHLAASAALTRQLLNTGATCIAYETVTDEQGGLPLLAPMSRVAGRVAVQAGAHNLEKSQGGRGVLLGGLPDVEPGRVLVLGGGIVGSNAADVALGMGASVTLLDKSESRLAQLQSRFREFYVDRFRPILSSASEIDRQLTSADLVVGAVLVPGATTPRLVRREHLSTMQPGTVLVDVSIDQGGCFATSRPTTHEHPTFLVDNIVHYCVANIPGCVPRTATLALSHATRPAVLALADQGIEVALRHDPLLRDGLNIFGGRIAHRAVAESHGLEYQSAEELLFSI